MKLTFRNTIIMQTARFCLSKDWKHEDIVSFLVSVYGDLNSMAILRSIGFATRNRFTCSYDWRFGLNYRNSSVWGK